MTKLATFTKSAINEIVLLLSTNQTTVIDHVYNKCNYNSFHFSKTEEHITINMTKYSIF